MLRYRRMQRESDAAGLAAAVEGKSESGTRTYYENQIKRLPDRIAID